MELIDLLNKMANGEELPEKIVFKDTIYKLNDNSLYCDVNNTTCENCIGYNYCIDKELHTEVIVIDSKYLESDNLSIKVEYDTYGVYINYKGTKVYLSLDRNDYGSFIIKEFLHGPINSWAVIEEKEPSTKED